MRSMARRAGLALATSLGLVAVFGTASLAGSTLVLIPTAVQSLTELRINTGRRAVLRDGSRNVVYVKKTPAAGNTLLHFRLDIASDNPVTLRSADLRLIPPGADSVGYGPVDWFLDAGLDELRGDSLVVSAQGIVQFTIEVPEARADSLTLRVAGQTVGTVAAIKEGIRKRSGLPD